MDILLCWQSMYQTMPSKILLLLTSVQFPKKLYLVYIFKMTFTDMKMFTAAGKSSGVARKISWGGGATHLSIALEKQRLRNHGNEVTRKLSHNMALQDTLVMILQGIIEAVSYYS